jgi:hypothetical protein
LISESAGDIVCPDVFMKPGDNDTMPRIQATGGAGSTQAMKNVKRYEKIQESFPGASSCVLGHFLFILFLFTLVYSFLARIIHEKNY